jgi:aerobic-type carbon monoxide dehydrogenase small subunit (CoxS/CutS family)
MATLCAHVLHPCSAVAGRSVQTLSGLTENGKPSRLQQAFIDEQAAQCGYCTSGMILQSQALLKRNPKPTEQEVRQAWTVIVPLWCTQPNCSSSNEVVKTIMMQTQPGLKRRSLLKTLGFLSLSFGIPL